MYLLCQCVSEVPQPALPVQVGEPPAQGGDLQLPLRRLLRPLRVLRDGRRALLALLLRNVS